MLQTGTIGGNNFDILGTDSLGGQSFLQAFILAVFPLSMSMALILYFALCLSHFS